MVSELQPDRWMTHISTKCQSKCSVGNNSYRDLQAHCTCYLHLQLMGSTAVVFIHHRTPYMHLSMSYSGFSSALAWPRGYFIFLNSLDLFLPLCNRARGMGWVPTWLGLIPVTGGATIIKQEGWDRQGLTDQSSWPSAMTEQARFKESGVGLWETCLRLLLHADGSII